MQDYSLLLVDSGEIIHATRDYRLVKFREILKRHLKPETTDRVTDDPRTGVWKKVIWQEIPSKKTKPVREP